MTASDAPAEIAAVRLPRPLQAALADVPAAALVLVAPARDGALALSLARDGRRVVAVDPSAEAVAALLEAARAALGVDEEGLDGRLRAAPRPLDALGLDAGSCDAAVLDAVERLEPALRRDLLREAARVVRGPVVVGFRRRARRDGAPWMRFDALREDVAAAGLRSVRVHASRLGLGSDAWLVAERRGAAG